MAWKKDDFECSSCGNIFEELYKKDEIDDVYCLSCGCPEVTKLLSCPNMQMMSAMTPEQQRETMMRRSAEHTQKQIDKEPERWGDAGMARRSKKIQG